MKNIPAILIKQKDMWQIGPVDNYMFFEVVSLLLLHGIRNNW